MMTTESEPLEEETHADAPEDADSVEDQDEDK